MRRKEREVTDLSKIEELLRTQEVMRVSMNDGEYPYTVPLNFGYFMHDNEITLYFHCAKEGKKISLLDKDNKVFILIDGNHELIRANCACSYTYHYRSLMGRAKARKVSDPNEKEFALNCMMHKFAGSSSFQFPSAILERLEIIRLDLSEYTCKENS